MIMYLIFLLMVNNIFLASLTKPRLMSKPAAVMAATTMTWIVVGIPAQDNWNVVTLIVAALLHLAATWILLSIVRPRTDESPK